MNDDNDSPTIIEQNVVEVEEEKDDELIHDNDDSTCSSHDSDDTEQILQTINNGSKITNKQLHHSSETAAATTTKTYISNANNTIIKTINNNNNNKRKRQHDINSDSDDDSTSFDEKTSYSLNKNGNSNKASQRTYSETKTNTHIRNERQQHDDDNNSEQQEQMSSSSSTSSTSIDTMILKQRIRRPFSTILINKRNDQTISKSSPTSTCQATSPPNSAALSALATRQQQQESSSTPKTGNSRISCSRNHKLNEQEDDKEHVPPRNGSFCDTKKNDDNYQSNDDFNRKIEEDDENSDKENDVESVDTEKLLYTIRHGGTIHNSSTTSTGTNDKVLSTTTSKSNQNITPTRDIGHMPSTDVTTTTTTLSNGAVTSTENNVVIPTTNNNNTRHQQNSYDDITGNNNNINDIFALPEYDSDDDDDNDNGSISSSSIQIPATSVNQEEFQIDNENVRNTPIARIHQYRNVANNIGIETGTTIASNIRNDRVTTSHINSNTATIINSDAIDRSIGILVTTPNATVKKKCFNPYSKQDRAAYDALKETPKIVHQQQQQLQRTTTPLQNPYSRSSLTKGTVISSQGYDKIQEPRVTNIMTAPSTIPTQKEQPTHSSTFTLNRTNTETNKNELVYLDSKYLTDDQLIESAFFFNMDKSPAHVDAAVELTNRKPKTPPVQVTIRNGIHGTKQSFVPPGSVSSVSSTTNLSSNYRQQHRQQYQQLGHSYEQKQQELFHSKYHGSPQNIDKQNQFRIDDIEDFSDDDHDHRMYRRNSNYTDRIIPQQLYDNNQMNSDMHNMHNNTVYCDDQIYPISNVVHTMTQPINSYSLPASNCQQQCYSGCSDSRIDHDYHLNNNVGYENITAATTTHSPPFESLHQYTNSCDDDRYVDLSTVHDDDDDDDCNFQTNGPELMNQGFVNRVSDVSGAYVKSYSINPGSSVSATFNNNPHDVFDNDPYQPHLPSNYETLVDNSPTYTNNMSRYGNNSRATAQTSVMYHGRQEPPPNPPTGRRIRDSSKDPSYIQGVVLGHPSKTLTSIPTAMPNENVASMPRRFFRTSASNDTIKANLGSKSSNIPSHEPEIASVSSNHAPSQPPPTATAASVRNNSSHEIDSYFPPVGTGGGGVTSRNRYYSNSVLANEVSKANQKPLIASSVHLRNDLQGGSGVGVGNFRLVKETVANHVKEATTTKSSNSKTNFTKPSYKRKKKGTGGRRGGNSKKQKRNNGGAASGRGGSGNFNRNNVHNNHNNRRGQQQSQRSSSSSSWGGNRDDPNLHNVGGADMNF